MKCKVCSGSEFEIVIEREYPRHLICNRCGFTFLEKSNQPEGFYQEDYWREHHGISGSFDLNKVRVPARSKKIFGLIKDYLKEDSFCLEIGAGFGHTLNLIRNSSKSSVFGIEPSKEGCENMQRNKISYFEGSLEDFETDKKFDIIILSHVFEHLCEPMNVMDKIKSLINDDAVIYVEVPNLLRPEFYKNLKHWFSKEHVFYYTFDKLNFFFNQGGFAAIYSKESHVVTALFAQSSEVSAKYSDEFKKVKFALSLHNVMYYPARVVRELMKLFKRYD